MVFHYKALKAEISTNFVKAEISTNFEKLTPFKKLRHKIYGTH